MNPMRMLILLTVVGTTGSILFAAEPAGTPKQQTAAPTVPAAPAAEQSPAKQEAKQEQKQPQKDEAAAAAAPSSADAGPSPQRFVPSEQVRADFDVSFPIDI